MNRIFLLNGAEGGSTSDRGESGVVTGFIWSVFRRVERRGQRFHAEVVRVEEKVVIKEEKNIGLLFPLGAEC